MNDNDLFKYGQYLSHLISCTINDTVPGKPFEGFDWNRFYKLTCFHKSVSLVFPVLSHLNVPEDILRRFTYDNNRMIAREARQEIESQKIFTALEKNGVPFIKMKGIVMKNLYPAPYMRSQADVDICMSEENRRRCASLMKDLGYEVFAEVENTDEYVKDDFFYYELHSSVNTSYSGFYKLFDEPFSKVKPAQDSVGFVFTDEYFYLHLVTHLYKHFITEGCGIRLLCDLYIFEKAHPDMNFGFIRSTLDEYEITDFYDNIIKLNSCLFEGEDFTEQYKSIAVFIFKCGDHGSDAVRYLTMSNTDKIAAFTKKNRFRVILQIYFPKAETLKMRYPILEKAPVLLPFYWVKRGFSTVFFKRNAIKQQSERVRSINSDEIKEAQKVRDLVGITKDIH